MVSMRYIDSWRTAMPYRSVNPTTGDLIGTFPNHTDAEIELKLAEAHSVYRSTWSTGPLSHRLEVLSSLADTIESQAERLARILVLEMGKRISEARWEVDVTARIARYYATHAEAFLEPVQLQTERGDAWIEVHPNGVDVGSEPGQHPDD